MSRIEEALKKAKLSRGMALTVVNSPDNEETDIDSRRARSNLSLVAGSDVSTVNHKSSVKEIALMDESNLLDKKTLSELKIIFSDMPDNKIADTYRDLRTKLIQKSKGKAMSVMLTSCVPGYYSSMTALNLAAAFSLDESKTSLLIDCNLNNPQLDKKLNLEGADGLTDYLEDECVTVDSILQKSGIKRLRFIPAGKSREIATEYFTSLRMRELMSNLLARYSDRYLFIDAAPIVDSADTRILVELCDYVVMVVPYGQATRNRVREAAESIGKDKFLGVVFADKPAVPKFSIIRNSKKNNNNTNTSSIWHSISRSFFKLFK